MKNLLLIAAASLFIAGSARAQYPEEFTKDQADSTIKFRTAEIATLNADIINQGLVRGDTAYIVRAGGEMLALSLLQVACAIAAVYFGAHIAMGLGRDLRAALFERVLSFSGHEVGHFGAPSLITRTTNDVQQVQLLVLMVSTLFVAAPIVGKMLYRKRSIRQTRVSSGWGS